MLHVHLSGSLVSTCGDYSHCGGADLHEVWAGTPVIDRADGHGFRSGYVTISVAVIIGQPSVTCSPHVYTAQPVPSL